MVLAADCVIVVFAVIRRVFPQLGDEGLGIALDDLAGLN